MTRAGPERGGRKRFLPITQKRRHLRDSPVASEESGHPEPSERLRLLMEERERLDAEIKAIDAALAAQDAAGGRPPAPRRRHGPLDIPKKPVVPVARSVRPEYIVCLIDGERRKMLHRYLLARYGIFPDEYRRHFGLPEDYPMTAPGYSRQKSAEAKQQGFGRWDRLKAQARKDEDADA